MKRAKGKKVNTSHSKVSNKSSSKNSKKESKHFNIDWKIWVILGVVVFLILAVLINVFININGNAITGFAGENEGSSNTDKTYSAMVENAEWEAVLTDLAGTSNINPTIPIILRGIFGPAVKITQDSARNSALSAVVLTLCVWLLILLTFSNILSSFSTFSKGISWGIAAVFATIMAQFNFQMKAMLLLARWTGLIGGALTLAGILAAFVAFFAVNTGIIAPLQKWAQRRNTAVQKVRIQNSAEKIAALKIADMKIAKAMADEEKREGH